ncbi:MAG: DinB family protein [Proteobacteria bacterium]|nr:MAG: DinB family protein [Pseudomonadota bacterium]
MNDLFNPESARALMDRLEKLEAQQPPLWGRMNAAQMLTHCQAPFAVYFGELELRQSVAGLLFGRFAKRKLFSGKPWPRGLPTAKEFVVTDERSFEEEREKLEALIRRFTDNSLLLHPPRHPFFGKMTAQEWSHLAYRHLDHHLQQFGV